MFILAHNDPNWIALGIGIGVGLGLLVIKLLFNGRTRN
jgi:hypothetical protein